MKQPARSFFLLLTALFWLFVPKSSLGGDPLRFFVLGDWGRGGDKSQRSVATAMAGLAADSSVDFTVSTGDNFYENGVKSVQDKKWLKSFDDVYSAPSLQHPWYAILGNHDWRSDWQAQIDFSLESDRWTMPDRHFAVTWPVGDSSAVTLFFIDTNVIEYDDLEKELGPSSNGLTQWEAEVTWLDSVLSDNESHWKIVVGHHPIYSSSGHHGPSHRVRELIEPLLKRYSVVAYFNGHEHDLQHQDPGYGVHYFTSGAGSKTRRAGVNSMTRLAWGRTPGTMLVTLDDSTMRVDVFDGDRTEIYSVTLDDSGTVIGGGDQRIHLGRWFPPW